MRYFIVCCSLLLGCSLVGQLQAAESPASLQSLFNRIPNLPERIEDAVRWVDNEGRIVAPQLTDLSGDLVAQREAVNVIANSQNAASRKDAEAQIQSVNQGISNAGIDVQRLQSDPAYAQQVQASMQKMSPQELMAMSQKMTQPMQQNPTFSNQAQLQANESGAVKQAAAAGAKYSGNQAQRIQASEAIWQQAAADIKRLQQQPLQVQASKPRSDWDDVSCNRDCRAQWEVYTTQMLPLLEARANQILKIQQQAVKQHRAALSQAVKDADRHMQATAYGKQAQSQLNLAYITGYDIGMVGDMEQLVTHVSKSVEDAAYVKQCGKQMIRSPHALCVRNLQ